MSAKASSSPSSASHKGERTQAGRVDQHAAARQQHELTRGRRVTAAVILAHLAGCLHVGADERVDERRLADARRADQRDRAVRARERPQGVDADTGAELVTITSTPVVTSAISAAAASGSGCESAFVSTTTGVAPLSNASTSSRSSRRGFGPFVSDCTTSTMSMFAATTCSSRAHSFDRVTADERRAARQNRYHLTAADQHPVAGRDPVSAERRKVRTAFREHRRSPAVDAHHTCGCGVGDLRFRDEARDLVVPTELEQRRHWGPGYGGLHGQARVHRQPDGPPRRARRGRRARTRAFYDDPLFGFFFPNLLQQTAGSSRSWAGVADAKPFNEIWVARTADGKVASAAVWLPPGATRAACDARR